MRTRSNKLGGRHLSYLTSVYIRIIPSKKRRETLMDIFEVIDLNQSLTRISRRFSKLGA